MTLVTVIQFRPMRVRFSVSTAELTRMFHSLESLKKEAVVRLRLSNGEEYSTVGKIELANNQANARTDAVQVYASFPNDDFKLLPGSTLTVTLSKKNGHKVPAVPLSAVMHDRNGAYVYVVDGNDRAVRRTVVTGNATAEVITVRSGVKPGERVVTQGTHKVVNGMELDIVRGEK